VAPQESPEATPVHGGTRRRIRIPTSLIVALLGGALTILILPAFTRQWDERHRALDLKNELVEEISTATGESITSAEVVFEKYQGPKESKYELSTLGPGLELRRAWISRRLKIEGRLRAYFGPELFVLWRSYDRAMVNFLYLAGLEGRINRDRRKSESERPPTQPIRGFEVGFIDGFLDSIGIPGKARDRGIRSALLSGPLVQRRSGFVELEYVVLEREAAFTGQLLAAHPNGFSTTRRDLINDLLP
jgi:hypothetical protein